MSFPLPSFFSIASILLLVCCSSPSLHETKPQPYLGYKHISTVESSGKVFKDLNKNGILDPYEDWTLSPEERSQSLLGLMTLEEKVGFMLISTTRMENEYTFEFGRTSNEPIKAGFNEEDLVQTHNIFTRQQLPVPMVAAAGTTKGVNDYHLRHFILRANVASPLIAEWANLLQELCEKSRLGIPAIIASNPRNHITADAAPGLSVGITEFSAWPGELGLSAMRDLKLTREFADIARQEWVSVGLRKGYMYMADLATEPRWQRINGTFGEDADWVAAMTREVVLGFQGESLNSKSVALTTKHFPGGGSGEGGQDPHFPWGKNAVYPGEMADFHLKPFIAAIEAGTSSIMPYYSMPVGSEHEEVAFAYNKSVIQDLLRERLGFEGIINSDTGPIEMMPWGVESFSIKERYQKAMEAGVNLFSGTADPSQLLQAVKEGLIDEELVDKSVYLLLLEKFRLGLFENPYVDVEKAKSLSRSGEYKQKVDLAHRKSIVLLRNDKNVLPLPSGTKVYFEIYQKAGKFPEGKGESYRAGEKLAGLEFVERPDEADVILLWLFPRGQSLFNSDGSDLHVNLSSNGVNPSYVTDLAQRKPTVLVINYTNPWVIDEVYNDATRSKIPGVIATFGTNADALLDIVTGTFNPSGKMPFSTPLSNTAVAAQKEDVPGYLEGSDYALFHFDEGLSY